MNPGDGLVLKEHRLYIHTVLHKHAIDEADMFEDPVGAHTHRVMRQPCKS